MSTVLRRVRFAGSWAAAVILVVAILPHAVSVSWRGVLPVLGSVSWPAALELAGLWLLGLYVHSFVLTAAAPDLTHRRALTLNLTGSAVANVVPLGGAAGVELNRRMMRAWGMDGRSFAGYTFLTNLWDVGAKLLLPVVAVLALARAGEAVSQVQTAALVTGVGFVVVSAGAAFVLASARGAIVVGRLLEAVARGGLRLVGRDRGPDLASVLLDVRAQCAGLVARGWLRMSVGMVGYVALQAVLLGTCLHLTAAGCSWPEVLAAFAVERALTIVPVTPGGIGVADLGLVGVLLTLGGDPAGVAAAAVLYRAFVFVVEIPVGSGALGAWLLGQRLSLRSARTAAGRSGPTSPPRRIAHVTDVFLPRLGGIETHVDDLARHQRGAGLEADVLTPPTPTGSGPGELPWVRRLPAADARRAVTGYDVVHVHVSLFSPYGIGVARAAVRAGIPVLVTVHSLWTGAGAILRLAALSGLRRWPVAWSAVSGVAAARFGRPLGGVDVAVLPNALDVAAWRHPAPGTRPARTGGPVTIVSVMRLMPRKRPLQLVRMFARVRRLTGADVRLVLVGDGPLRRRVERYVRRHGLGGHVRITGRLSRSAVRDELAAASVYVAPAPKESFGIAALEARCVGLPVVASSRSGVGEFVRDRVEGILVGSDAELVAALADLVADRDLRERIAAHNRRVAPPFDWVDALARTGALYAAAADAAAVRPAPAGGPALVAAEA
ncbi:glycosyltransferase [Nocardioides aquiterrae]|uniref:Glycosyltransferase n=1 Tax=Nocardioides aquiterrae TaxID=203799 RepID=A0ABP4F6Y4_9ACTN